jgi:hypothetical protein
LALFFSTRVGVNRTAAERAALVMYCDRNLDYLD